MKALVSRSMKKKFMKLFPDWQADHNNEVWPSQLVSYKSPRRYYWLVSDNFTEAQKQFFVQNHVRMEEVI